MVAHSTTACRRPLGHRPRQNRSLSLCGEEGDRPSAFGRTVKSVEKRGIVHATTVDPAGGRASREGGLQIRRFAELDQEVHAYMVDEVMEDHLHAASMYFGEPY
jgi:hypothetical protein